jgi:hypothetical protein
VVGIEDQIDVGVFGEVKLLDLAIPVSNADEKFLDVTACGIDAECLAVHIEAQNSIVHVGTHLLSDISAAVPGAILGGDQFASLRRGQAGKEKYACDGGDDGE